MKSYWKDYCECSKDMFDEDAIEVRQLITMDYQKINKYSKRVNSHLVWTGMVTNKGEPRFKSNYLMWYNQTMNRPYQVKQFLFSSLSRMCKGCKIHSVCGNPLCIKLEHLSILDSEYFLSRKALKQLLDLSKIYPISYLSNFYQIKPRVLKRYLSTVEESNENTNI